MKDSNGNLVLPKWALGVGSLFLASVPAGVSIAAINRLEDRLEARIESKVGAKELETLRQDVAVIRVEVEESRRYRVDGFQRLARIEALLEELRKPR